MSALRCADDIEALRHDAQLYHRVMRMLQDLKLDHGLCEPRSRRACTHCNAKDDLAQLVADYKGQRIVAQSTDCAAST